MAFVNIAIWKPEQVAEWLKGLDDAMLPYYHFFLNESIDGKHLMSLTYDDLDRIGITKIGHQEMILEATNLLASLHYSLESEHLQSLALKLGGKARLVHNHLRMNISLRSSVNGSVHPDYLPTDVLSDISHVVTTLKTMVSWLDRPPFEDSSDDYLLMRNAFVKLGLELTQAAYDDSDILESEEKILTVCRMISDKCDHFIHTSKDPLTLQPCSLELATIRKKPEEELGMHIQSSYLGTHLIGGVKDQSPADICGKIEEGDEVIMVNYQMVVGWQLKKLVQILREKPREVILMLKKRPRHANIFGQPTNRRRRSPNKKPSTFPKLQKKRSREDKNVRTPLPPNFLHSEQEQLSPREVEDDNDVFRSGSESPNFAQLDAKQRRATVSGGSPTIKRPSLKLHELKEGRPRGNTIASPEAETVYDLSEAREQRDKKRLTPTKSFAFGEHLEDIHGIDSPFGSPVIQRKENQLKVPSKSSPKVKRSQEAAAREVAGGMDSSGSPQLLTIRKLDSVKRAEANKPSGNGNVAVETPPPAPTDSIAGDQSSSYTVKIVGGVLQKVPAVPGAAKADDESPVVRRRPKKSSAKSRIGGSRRRISCKDLGQGDCQGWLYMMREKGLFHTSAWDKVWCVLKQHYVYIYKSPEDLTAKVFLALPGYEVSPILDKRRTKKHAFKVRNAGSSFSFASDRQEDMVKWMNKMGLAAINYDASNIVTTAGHVNLGEKAVGVENPYCELSESDESDSEGRGPTQQPRLIKQPAVLDDQLSLISEEDSVLSLRLNNSERQHSKDNTSLVVVEDNEDGIVVDTSEGRATLRKKAKAGHDDFKTMCKSIHNADVDLVGANLKDRRTSALHVLHSNKRQSTDMMQAKKLQALSRTLKAKESELNDIEELLRSSLSPHKLLHFKELHPEVSRHTESKKKYEETDI
ncbi:CNK3/IPCEF1 fusion protein isoform X1 [Lingula anatina]|uniref:CNK3/IPCEF1 fusion protein isoform X1 n=3 Tax=Lingula anatina TaxID=7574 RepID=A0A1S3K1Q2_LINAN|nr:CNK3/IPCEF1 fusion protein isoform X1 [Lingula anatina]|eukprot:XP_013416563.1 CNK3/IPCEF1 fusion protein isoform X1 [Lingula anatina]